MYQVPREYMQEQRSLLNVVTKAEGALISLACEIDRLKSGVSVDENITLLISQLQPLLRRHLYSVLASNIPVSDNIDDYILPCYRNPRKLHKEEETSSCGAYK